jgi:prepilin-type N-terminal cleavage/methylation domain-containing protein
MQMIFFLTFKEKQECGFSMIELLIAMSITSVFILGTAQLTLHSTHLKQKSDCLVRAAELASTALERFKSLPYDSMELEDTDYEETIQDERSSHLFFRGWTIRRVSASMKRIEVDCFAQNHPRKRMQVALFLSRELGF